MQPVRGYTSNSLPQTGTCLRWDNGAAWGPATAPIRSLPARTPYEVYLARPAVVHDAAESLRSFSMRRPSARARSAQRRVAVWNSFLHSAEQNFFGFAPTVLAENGAPHQKQRCSSTMELLTSNARRNDAHTPQRIRGFGTTTPHPYGVTVVVHPNVPTVAS